MSSLISAYDDFAADYERTRVPRFRPIVKQLLQRYDTRPGSHVVDAGCGTGLASTMVAPRVGHSGKILGIDTSLAMLEIARRKAQGFGFDQCEFVLGDISHLNLPDNSADLVICSFALWGKPDALFREFWRVLKPDGALLAQNWDMGRWSQPNPYRETLGKFISADPDPKIQQLRSEFDSHSRDWDTLRTADDYLALLRRVGFTRADGDTFSFTGHFKNLAEYIEFHSLGARVRTELAAMDEPTRSAFFADVTTALQPLDTSSGIDEAWRVVQISARK